jgi:hypothetical protein
LLKHSAGIALKTKITITILLSIAFAADVLTCMAQDTITFRIVRNIALIEGYINGTAAYFILDTGASITLLNESLAYKYDFKTIDNKFFAQRHIVGLGGRSSIKEVRSAVIRIGPHEINFINKASNLDNLSEYFNDPDIKVAGIIGIDLLRVLGGKIDFTARTIVLHCRHK